MEQTKVEDWQYFFKTTSNFDLVKTYQDPHGRFLCSEIKVKNSFSTIAIFYNPNVDDSVFFRNVFTKLTPGLYEPDLNCQLRFV